MMSFDKTPGLQFSFHIDAHQFGSRLHQTLSGHNHFHFTGADTECNGAESAMGGSMAIATNDGHSGLVMPSSGPITCTMP